MSLLKHSRITFRGFAPCRAAVHRCIKIRKNIVPPRDMAAKPVLDWRWPPGHTKASAGQLLSLGVSCRAKRSQLTVFLSGPRVSMFQVSATSVGHPVPVSWN